MIRLNKDVTAELRDQKFSFVKGSDFVLSGNFDDFFSLTKSWERMGGDIYFGNEGKASRYRRYSDFNYNPATNELSPLEHRPYFQSEEMNAYVGGKERHFEDFGEEVLHSPVLRSLIQQDFEVYAKTLPEEFRDRVWQCQIHQIRIEIEAGKETEITPEGIHSDGYPYSAVHFWGRENVEGAYSKLYDADKNELITVQYTDILDTTFFFDREMFHYVTPARTVDPETGGYRQIIAISFSLPGSEYDTVR
ncbi:2OG-Fe dioxygenase family protein [Photobacterium sp. 1_MG-2023]|uniref:2OG-Fe dioxygenase family protein n=1 Tax=Photobacterium sp. 1_MG-2023 TaxID=3062646 RepID=UPI0026E2B97C|nr:2OG-Fe dioxygenase family protein [Photobacterium sp. 1_MG-2023]MDO6705084.1 2OG-Fe dioxygenase family protein [Photobacterium sp. 1_MG-2023]